MNNQGSGIYTKGKKVLFNIPEMLHASCRKTSPENCDIAEVTVRSIARTLYRDHDVTIVRSSS